MESFNPPSDAARDALTKVLTAWQSGQGGTGQLELTNPTIHFADPAWLAGGKLQSFEIIKAGEADSPREFTVKRSLEGDPAPSEVVYVVVGKETLWVMLREEFERTSGM